MRISFFLAATVGNPETYCGAASGGGCDACLTANNVRLNGFLMSCFIMTALTLEDSFRVMVHFRVCLSSPWHV